MSSALRPGLPAPTLASSPLRICVAAVREQQGRHVEPLARLRPQRLQRVHAAAVAFEADDLAVGARHRRAGRDRHAPCRSSRPCSTASRAAPRPGSARRSRGRSSPPRRRRSRSPAAARRATGRAPRRDRAGRPAPAAGSLTTGAGVRCAPTSSASASSAPIGSSSGRAQHVALRSRAASAGSACRDRRRTRPASSSPTRMMCFEPGQHLERLVDDIRHPLERHPAAAALGARVRALRHQPRAGLGGDLRRPAPARPRATPGRSAAASPARPSAARAPPPRPPRPTAPPALPPAAPRRARCPRSRRCRRAGSGSRSGPAACAPRRSPRRRPRRSTCASGEVLTQCEDGRARPSMSVVSGASYWR